MVQETALFSCMGSTFSQVDTLFSHQYNWHQHPGSGHMSGDPVQQNDYTAAGKSLSQSSPVGPGRLDQYHNQSETLQMFQQHLRKSQTEWQFIVSRILYCHTFCLQFSQLTTYYQSFLSSESNVTDSTPGIIDADFNSPLCWVGPSN